MCRCHRSKAIFIVASCMLWLVLFISYDCSILICTIPFRGSLSPCACDIYILFLFPLCLDHVNLEMGVESKGWGMHCQLAEHETFYVSWSKNIESVLTPLQNCQSSSDSRLSWNNLLGTWQIHNNPPISVPSHPFTLTGPSAWKHFPWDAHGAGSLSSFRSQFSWSLIRDNFIGHPYSKDTLVILLPFAQHSVPL